MKSFVFALISSAVIGAVLIKADFDNARTKAVYNKCLNAHPLPPGEEQHFKKKDIVPSSRNAKCLIACLLKEGKILSDGKYSLDMALKVADEINKDRPENNKKAKEVTQKCATEVGTDVGSDDCEFAYKMFVCVREEGKKVKLETPNY
uniref:OBP8 n=1 Tax=Corythucha ciliata TaxID=369451 RepID=A0A3G2YUZ8_CORCT|nr:OBP8 [Corythucha ciliata]